MTLAAWIMYAQMPVNIHIKTDLHLNAGLLLPGKLVVTLSPSPFLHKAASEREQKLPTGGPYTNYYDNLALNQTLKINPNFLLLVEISAILRDDLCVRALTEHGLQTLCRACAV